MKRNLKALGLALVAAFAMSAVAASAASADFISTSDGTTVLTSEALTNQVFKTGGGAEVSCANVAVDGSVTGTTAETITVVPTYSNCSITLPGVGTVAAFVDSEGCTYEFTTNTEVHIRCPANKKIVVTAELAPPVKSKCLEIPAQTPTTPEVHYVNNASSGNQMDVKVVSTVSGVTYTKVGPCGSNVTANDATYTGEVTVKGHDSGTGAQVGVTKVS